MPDNFYLVPDSKIFVLHVARYFWIPVNIVEPHSGTHLSYLRVFEFFQVLILSFISWDQNLILFRIDFAPLRRQNFSEVFIPRFMRVGTLAGGHSDGYWRCVNI